MQKKTNSTFLALILGGLIWISPAPALACDGCALLSQIAGNTGRTADNTWNIYVMDTRIYQELKDVIADYYLAFFKKFDETYLRPAIGEFASPNPDVADRQSPKYPQFATKYNPTNRCTYVRWFNDQYQEPPRSSSIINLLFQIVFSLQGNASSDACIADDSAQADAQSLIAQARAKATAKVAIPYSLFSAQKAYRDRCLNGFNPTDEAMRDGEFRDPEGKLNKKSLNCADQKDNYVRQDRSMESLLGPLQYLAPAGMVAPAGGTEKYSPFRTNLTDIAYLPIYAAAGFCQNIALYSIPIVSPAGGEPLGTTDIANRAAVYETLQSRILSDCWHFFEERVQYPKDSANFKDRHDAQYARCLADYKKNIINQEALGVCNDKGRSTLKALADMAYRADSRDYTIYLQSLNSSTQEMIMALAQSDMLKFEQQLLLERQIMSQALSTAQRGPVDLSTEQQLKVHVNPPAAAHP